MSKEFSLRTNEQRRLLRWTVVVFPLLLFYALLFLFEGIFNAIIPGPKFDICQVYSAVSFWCLAVPALYACFLATIYSEKLQIKNGRLYFGFLGRESLDLATLVEISGDGGTYANNFRERLVLNFNDGTIFNVNINAYEDEEIRKLLAEIKRIVPLCRLTYSEVIPLESRGLLKFLVNTAPVESMILELSKNPVTDLIMQLVKQNEKRFLTTYTALSLALIAMLAFGACLNHREICKDNHGHINTNNRPLASLGDSKSSMFSQIKASEQRVRELQSKEATNFSDQIEIFNAKQQAFLLALADYWQSSGAATAQVLWMGIGFIIISLRIVGATSPQFLFVDSKTVGMGCRFNSFESVGRVSLKKNGDMGDPLDGILEIEATDTLVIDLARISELQQRHLLLRLIDRYSGTAQRNEDFMRTTNAIVDIQFTDLWLKSSEQQAEQNQREQEPQNRLLNEKYRIKSVLGFGGQGTTYIATAQGENEQESEQLVIKETVLPTQADVRVMLDTIHRWKRGAALLEQLEHPQIVKLVDDFVENDRAYLVMEYIKGETLRQLVKANGVFSEEAVIKLGIEICEIIEYLHTRQAPVIHCDLAPDNLILSDSGKLKLVDFDVARVVDGESHSLIAGRPSYTPPEQFRGKPVVQSDIFALGAIMHFLLLGTDPPPLGSGFDEEADANLTQLEHLIRHCLAFEVVDRPPSAAELNAQLKVILEQTGGETIVLEKEEDKAAVQVQNRE